MRTSIQLRADVHAVAIDDDLVLLDVAADTYLCAPGAADLLRAGRSGRLEPASKAAAQALLDAGLAVVGPPSILARPALPRPSRGPGQLAAAPAVPDARRLLASLADFQLHYRGRRFAQILQYIRTARAARLLCREDEAVAAAAARFEAAAVWLPAPGKCLARSFLLIRFLQRSGLDADWVIGVRTWPFRAHCWVQLGDRALDEPPERLAAYHPICVV